MRSQPQNALQPSPAVRRPVAALPPFDAVVPAGGAAADVERAVRVAREPASLLRDLAAEVAAREAAEVAAVALLAGVGVVVRGSAAGGTRRAREQQHDGDAEQPACDRASVTTKCRPHGAERIDPIRSGNSDPWVDRACGRV